MWSVDAAVHEECKAQIVAVASEPDVVERYALALRQIAAGTATLPSDVDRAKWAGVMAMYALNPELFGEEEQD